MRGGGAGAASRIPTSGRPVADQWRRPEAGKPAHIHKRAYGSTPIRRAKVLLDRCVEGLGQSCWSECGRDGVCESV